jgi:hypothetical protein
MTSSSSWRETLAPKAALAAHNAASQLPHGVWPTLIVTRTSHVDEILSVFGLDD